MDFERFSKFISEDIPDTVEKGCQGGCGKALIVIGLLAASAGIGYLVTRPEVHDIIEPFFPDDGTSVPFPSDRQDLP